jgi:RNA polymerase sigma factor (sigma-70 family)
MSNVKITEKTDQELMLLYQDGNENAFEELYRRYSGKVYSYLQKRLTERNWVDDVFQMVFTKLHQTRHQYNPSYRFDQWIFVMTKTVLLDFWKTTGVKTSRFFSTSIDNVAQSKLPIAEPVTEKPGFLPELIMATLSSDQRHAVELKFIDELSYQEIAKKLSRSEESVRQLISRGIRKIRKQNKNPGDNL